MVSKIVKIGNPILRQKTTLVTKFDNTLQNLLSDMNIAMKEAKGIGLAANQIGVSLSVCIISLDLEQDSVAYINPEITETSDPVSFNEACLSIPGVSEKTTRFNKIAVKYQNHLGEFLEEKLEGIAAIVMQHEVDHLDGKLYVDKLSRLKRQLLAKQYKRNQ